MRFAEIGRFSSFQSAEWKRHRNGQRDGIDDRQGHASIIGSRSILTALVTRIDSRQENNQCRDSFSNVVEAGRL